MKEQIGLILFNAFTYLKINKGEILRELKNHN